jgi:formamidopyrimidine-DNA glycosylase
MPELPELEVVKEVLQRRLVGKTLEQVEVLAGGGAIVVRDLTRTGLAEALCGAGLAAVERRGKFLLFSFDPIGASSSDSPLYLLINPKLTGRLQLAAPDDKRRAKTQVVFSFSSGEELRYVDQRAMGQLYLTRDPNEVPDYASLGPEPFTLSLEQFRTRLLHFRGEIKGVLTRGECIAGIGNAYADEILWVAQLHPYRKRTQLTPAEVERLYNAVQSTLREAIEQVRAEMGETIDLKPRDFLAVHLKSGEPCPRCGTPISLIGAHQRITNFCRTCQPGGLIKGM